MNKRGANDKPIESVWDFPRPPSVELVEWHVRVVHEGATIVDAPRAFRLLETTLPPTYYIAPEFVDESRFAPSDHHTLCEWKGLAEYSHLIGPATDEVQRFDAAWRYRRPSKGYVDIANHWGFYAQKLEACWVDDELVVSPEGSFYGGWVTNNVTGPFKGGPGTNHW